KSFFGSIDSRFKLVNQRSYNRITCAGKKLYQVLACLSILYGYLTFFERLRDLIVQINAVSNQDDLRILDLRMRSNQLSQHDHSEGFTTSLSVPDYTAFS